MDMWLAILKREFVHIVASPFIWMVTYLIFWEIAARSKWKYPMNWIGWWLPSIPWTLIICFAELYDVKLSLTDPDVIYPWWKSYIDISVWQTFMSLTGYAVNRIHKQRISVL